MGSSLRVLPNGTNWNSKTNMWYFGRWTKTLLPSWVCRMGPTFIGTVGSKSAGQERCLLVRGGFMSLNRQSAAAWPRASLVLIVRRTSLQTRACPCYKQPHVETMMEESHAVRIPVGLFPKDCCLSHFPGRGKWGSERLSSTSQVPQLQKGKPRALPTYNCPIGCMPIIVL